MNFNIDPKRVLGDIDDLLSRASGMTADGKIPLNPRRQGYGYYNYQHGLLTLKAIAKLARMPSRTSRVNLLNSKQAPQTFKAKLTQGHQYLLDGGMEHMNAAALEIDDAEFERIKPLVEGFRCTLSKFTITMRLAEDADKAPLRDEEDFLAAMTEVPLDAPDEFSSEAYRTAVIALTEGPMNQQLERQPGEGCWPGVPLPDAQWTERLIRQLGPEYLYSYQQNTGNVYLAKVDEQTAAALKG